MDDEKFFLAENILVSHIISATEGKWKTEWNERQEMYMKKGKWDKKSWK